MARLVVAILVLAFAAFALADVQYQYNWNAYETTDPVSEDYLCELVGRTSGCSGCEHGTKGLCAWVAGEGGNDKRVFEMNQYFSCVPRTQALAESLNMVGHICPVDPTKEPSLRVALRSVFLDKLPETSVVFSSHFDARLAAFPREPWAVDRTSYYGPVGNVALGSNDLLEDRLDCARIVSPQIVDLEKEEGENAIESTLLNGKLVDDRDKFCVKQALAAFISSRCPEYGVAVSGLCSSFYHRLRDNCGFSHLGPNSGLNSYSKALEMWTVVPDATAYCIKDFPIYPAGEMEAMAGLHIPTATLQKMDRDGKPFWYDPPTVKK